ncbi:BMC domain-containing protein [Desulfosediminicola flagellatus]|uniref:BMC domain-containing protein n=1 Tax=Desulfosediminicola flagellatus TaxID=2569541 RepID=UPI0010ACA8DA|nr:BMC domain-containing protein [Desulfosediminicola flagellatus]
MKTTAHSIGVLELSSIAAGYQAQDAMLKAADITILIARTICSGKFLIIAGGSVSAVNASLEAGEAVVGSYLIEKLTIANVDQQIFSAIAGTVHVSDENFRALGIVETFSATNIIEAADAAAKAADVTLFRVHVSMAIGGKGYFLATGDVSAVQAAVDAACSAIELSGMLVNRVVIPAASKEMLQELL